MRRLSIVLWLTALFASANAQQATLTVTNPGDQQRLEVVEADLQAINKLLGTISDASLIVRNALGQEQPYQKSYDGKLLMYVSVQPHSKAEFTITKGKAAGFKFYVFGKLYPERADDITWENDLGIYRVYGPALQRSGVPTYG